MSGRVLSFRVNGTPVAQGSVALRGRVLVATTPALEAWRDNVRAEALTAAEEQWGASYEHIDAPVSLLVFFYLPMPRKPLWEWPAVKPDGDKLLRAVQDSLSTFPERMTRGKRPKLIPGKPGVIKDDARIISGTYHKRYALVYGPGAFIALREEL